MKKQEMEIISEKEEKLIDVMMRLDIVRGTARTLVYMLSSKNNAVSSIDIERAATLRQPEVSVATAELRNLGILSQKSIKHKGKGRPTHRYSLKKSPTEIKSIITEKSQERLKKMEENLKTLDTLIAEMEK